MSDEVLDETSLPGSSENSLPKPREQVGIHLNLSPGESVASSLGLLGAGCPTHPPLIIWVYVFLGEKVRGDRPEAFYQGLTVSASAVLLRMLPGGGHLSCWLGYPQTLAGEGHVL